MTDHSTTVWRPPPRPRICGEWQAVATSSPPAPKPPPPPPPAQRLASPTHRPPPLTSGQPPQSNPNHYTQDPHPIDPISINPPRDHDHDPLVGTHLTERYRISAPIATGGQARVYKAEDTLFRRNVAIKVFYNKDDEQDAIDRACQQNFWAVEVLAQIQSPHIVQTLDVIKVGDHAYHHVMEFIDGESLAEHLAHHGPISWRRAAEIGVQLCDALIALHEHNPSGRRVCAVHRDIKPDNILRLASSDRFTDHVKLVDLGAAKRIARITRQVHMPSVEGPPEEELPLTWTYCAPEQDYWARGHGYQLPTTAGIHTDIFQVAEVLYELVTGAPPFPYDKRRILSEARERLYTDGIVRPPSALNPQAAVPPLFDHILLTALEKWPEHRFADAHAFRAALQELLRRTNTALPFEPWPQRLRYLTLTILVFASGFGGSHLTSELKQELKHEDRHELNKPAPPPRAKPTTTTPVSAATPPALELTTPLPATAPPAPSADGKPTPEPIPPALTPLGPAPPAAVSAPPPSSPKDLLLQATEDALKTCKRHLVDLPNWTIRAAHHRDGWTFNQDWTMDSRNAGSCVRTQLEKWARKNLILGKPGAFDLTITIAKGRRNVTVKRAKK
ncbi:MAG TPA: serine/threonine-protein kinase [Nannocystaceae bacterium]|nr:serine/threonine-protein kinase [Nannocystaceae bacterium]